ncbi:MAG: hypothetical protein M4579_006164 [Chaenotheca gracillima]|nr:MAG: hypothetical protein M4579_006164 [Chaenotheca gracillima]
MFDNSRHSKSNSNNSNSNSSSNDSNEGNGVEQVRSLKPGDEQSRRFSCDRCRGHKLRCERTPSTANGGGPCKRCLRAQAKCVISPLSRTQKPGPGNRARRQPDKLSDNDAELATNTASPPDRSLEDALTSSADGSEKSTQHHRVRKGSRASHKTQDRRLSTGPDSSRFLSDLASTGNDFIGGEANSPGDHWLGLHSSPMDTTGGMGAVTDTSSTIMPLSTSASLELTMLEASSGGPLDPSSSEFSTFDWSMGLTSNPLDHPESTDNVMDSSLGRSQQLANTSVAIPAQSGSEGVSPVDTSEDCVEKLSELSSSLMKDLSRIHAGKLSDTFFFLPLSPKGETGNGNRNVATSATDDFVCQENIIGRMLYSSEQFLDILKYFMRSGTSFSRASLPHPLSEGCYSEVDHESLSTAPTSVDANDAIDSASRRSFSDYSTHESSPNQHLSVFTDFTAMTRPTPATTDFSRWDVPTTLTILTCYISLVRIYRTVFSRILHSLLSCPSERLDLPPTLPGLQLGGFRLDNHANLQIKVLLEVSSHMLDWIEKALGLSDDPQRTKEDPADHGGLLKDSVPAALLKITLEQEEMKSAEGDEVKVKSLKEMMKIISGLVR